MKIIKNGFGIEIPSESLKKFNLEKFYGFGSNAQCYPIFEFEPVKKVLTVASSWSGKGREIILPISSEEDRDVYMFIHNTGVDRLDVYLNFRLMDLNVLLEV